MSKQMIAGFFNASHFLYSFNAKPIALSKKWVNLFSLGLAFCSLLIFTSGCGKDNGQHKIVSQSTKLASVSGGLSYKNLQPLFQQRCTPCHTWGSGYDNIKDVASGGVNSKVYKYVVLKSPKEMPLPGSPQSKAITDQERMMIGEWVKNGAPADIAEVSVASVSSGGPAAAVSSGPNCFACHGDHGLSGNSLVPNLFGLPEDYIKTQLKNFRNRTPEGTPVREDLTLHQMNGIAEALSDSEIQAYAAFFSKIAPTKKLMPETVDPKTAEIASNKFKQMNCVACHTSPPLPMDPPPPVLFGQNSEYIKNQLNRFKAGIRKSPIMQPMAQSLSDEEINALGEWLSKTTAPDIKNP